MEKILFSNNFNQAEYLRTLAKLNIPSFALRVKNDIEICEYVCQCVAKFPEGTYISSKEEEYIFFHLSGADYLDSKNLKAAIDSFRDSGSSDVLKSFDECLNENFSGKKELIKNQYIAYTKYKKDHNLYDKQDLISFVKSLNLMLDVEVNYFQEFGISKLLLDTLNHVFKIVKPLSINEVFIKQEKEIHFIKAYGNLCQVDSIFSEIQKYPLDECEIVLANKKDGLEISKTALMLDIPFTTHIGVPVYSTKAGNMLNYLFKLEDASYGVDGYKALFNLASFNKTFFNSLIPESAHNPDRVFSDFIKYAGWLRLNFNSDKSVIKKDLYPEEIASMLFELQSSLKDGRASFIEKYIVEPEPIDLAIIDAIRSIEKASIQYDFNLVDVLKDYLNKYINVETSKSGHLFVTDFSSAISSLRKHVFIYGLDSDFPGGPKENYLIFDEEYIKSGSNQYESKEIVKRNEGILRALINASNDLYLSYSYFNLASLEDHNPSSIIFDLYQGDVTKMPIYGYQDMRLSPLKEVYQARLNYQKAPITNNDLGLTYNSDVLLNKKYSPSMFKYYFESEHKLMFLISQILNINVDEENDPYEVMSAADKGTLIHEVIEGFNKNFMSKDEFLKMASDKFDRFLAKKPPLIPSSALKAREDYMRLMNNVYDDDPGNKHVYSEKYVEGKINDILFGGMFDRLETDKNNKYVLVDYKTGRNINHKNEDVVSCIQGMIYADLLEHHFFKKIVVDRIEFRYPDSKTTITIHYNDENKAAFYLLVDEFKNAIINKELFNNIDLKKQDHLDKYLHLFSLFKEVSNHG